MQADHTQRPLWVHESGRIYFESFHVPLGHMVEDRLSLSHGRIANGDRRTRGVAETVIGPATRGPLFQDVSEERKHQACLTVRNCYFV